MFQISSEETYEDGQIIFEEGSHGDWIYEVLTGSVLITKKVAGKDITIKTLKAGEVFGELGYIADIPRTATARALGETVVGVIDRAYLDKEFNKLSGRFRSILKIMAIRLSETTDIALNALINR